MELGSCEVVKLWRCGVVVVRNYVRVEVLMCGGVESLSCILVKL